MFWWQSSNDTQVDQTQVNIEDTNKVENSVEIVLPIPNEHEESIVNDSNESNESDNNESESEESRTKWVIKNNDYSLLSGMYFNSSSDAHKYIIDFIKEEYISNLNYSWEIEYCRIGTDSDYDYFTSNLDINNFANIIEDKNIDYIIYKLYKRHNLFFGIYTSGLEEVFIVEQIHEFRNIPETFSIDKTD